MHNGTTNSQPIRPATRAPVLVVLNTGLHLDRQQTGRHEPLALFAAWREPSPDGALWACGEHGAILRCGAGWERDPRWTLSRLGSPGEQLCGLGGTGPRDVWAVGSRGTVLRWDGERWRPLALPGAVRTLRAVFCSPPFVWIAGDAGVILHFDGKAWQRERVGGTPDLYAIAGSHVAGLWAVGQAGAVLTRDLGPSWTQLRALTTASLYGLSVSDAIDAVVAVGEHGTILRRDAAVPGWVHQPAPEAEHLLCVAHQGADLVAGGAGEQALLGTAAGWRRGLAISRGALCYRDQDLIAVWPDVAIGHRGGLFRIEEPLMHQGTTLSDAIRGRQRVFHA